MALEGEFKEIQDKYKFSSQGSVRWDTGSEVGYRIYDHIITHDVLIGERVGKDKFDHSFKLTDDYTFEQLEAALYSAKLNSHCVNNEQCRIIFSYLGREKIVEVLYDDDIQRLISSDPILSEIKEVMSTPEKVGIFAKLRSLF